MIYVFLSFIINNNVYILIYVYCVCMCVRESAFWSVWEPMPGCTCGSQMALVLMYTWVLGIRLGGRCVPFTEPFLPFQSWCCRCVSLCSALMWVLGSEPYACAAGTLLTELSPDNVYLNEGRWLLTSLAMDGYTTCHLDEQAWHQS